MPRDWEGGVGAVLTAQAVWNTYFEILAHLALWDSVRDHCRIVLLPDSARPEGIGPRRTTARGASAVLWPGMGSPT